MTINATRMKFHVVEVGGIKIEVPVVVRRRSIGDMYTYWLVRLEGIKKTACFSFSNPNDEFDTLIKALETSVTFIESLDPSSRLHEKRVAPKSDQTLPVGVRGPFTSTTGIEYYRVTVPNKTTKVREIRVAGENAREKAITLRKQGEASYTAARKAEAAEVMAGIKNLIRSLEGSRPSTLK